ncbi:hypothetical protein [Flammeovirga aprica]|uniref:Uncharacterized protein n=1 Tax=Flammeovirga aprica JL-4 TaxID=694437 RepID=A0A7X9NZT6_9BACT|nr:hypothetical protein [Flammeovirga aprica]NME66939.1 hypothetical protein [Flammeovirga aprica JL-4]
MRKLIYCKVKNGVYSLDSLNEKIQLPKKKKYMMLHQNFLVMYDDISTFKYKDQVLATYREMLQVAPSNPTLIYNLSALLTKCITFEWNEAQIKEVEKNISLLRSKRFNKSLVDKLILNRWLILSIIAYQKADFVKSDNYNHKIYSYYKNLEFNQDDKVRLAQHFVNYSLVTWATEILYDGIFTSDTSEDLLFYYINLTIVNDDEVEKASYKALMKKAIGMNRRRFCQLFNSYYGLNSGITFQLLDHPILKNFYCEECFEYIQEDNILGNG